MFEVADRHPIGIGNNEIAFVISRWPREGQRDLVHFGGWPAAASALRMRKPPPVSSTRHPRAASASRNADAGPENAIFRTETPPIARLAVCTPVTPVSA